MNELTEARSIRLRGVRVHNLKSIDLDLPRNALIVLTGVSGSGKSSLAFDTLFAEGQRRYVETFSAYTRQFLETLDKPDADRIEGIPPAIAVAQRLARRSGRSTVGTVTEIHDHLAVLYARIGRVICQRCGIEVRPADPTHVVAAIEALPERARYQVAYPLDLTDDTDLELLADRLRQEGFIRVRVDGESRMIDSGPVQRPSAGTTIDVVVDRLVRGAEDPSRRIDSIETAFQKGLGRCRLLTEAPGADRTFFRGWRCAGCGADYLPPEPALFRANSARGACPACEGLGRVAAERDQARPCPACGGARLRPEALAVRVAGLDIARLSALTIREAGAFLAGVGAPNDRVSERVLEPVRSRLGFLGRIGLGYLTLDRPARTLSDGEARRVALTTALGSSLVNTLYVLDEPTIGLHPRDVGRLVDAMQRLRDAGNSVVVVEHERLVIRAADRVIDFGPGAGAAGGGVLYEGPPEGLADCPGSATGDFLAGRKEVAVPSARRSTDQGWIELSGASGHNLRSVDARFPLGRLCVVAGVSGSGKSTLVDETLYPALAQAFGLDAAPGLPYGDLRGGEPLGTVARIDKAPIGRTPRSNPVTYVKAFDEIRKTFAATHDARARGYTPGTFSFNTAGGRCEACEGHGYRLVDMQFLPDVMVRCAECHGTRYRPEVLEVTYRGKSIAETLELTIREAFGHFRNRPRVQARLRPLIDVGLEYVRLGQPANTLSGGEAQRLKLAAFLAGSATAVTRQATGPKTLFLLDEPTTGLHPADVVVLLDALQSLVDLGHSLIVVEHSVELMAAADWIIELGPEAGNEGGRIVAAGTPEDLAAGETHTGRVLAEALSPR